MTSNTYRLGVYDPLDESGKVTLFGRVLSGSSYDRLVMRIALKLYRVRSARDKNETRCLAIFPVCVSGTLQTAKR